MEGNVRFSGSRAYFDEVAAFWDEMRSGFFPEAVREKAMTVAGVREGQLAADVGAGTGFVTEGLLRRGLRVVAMDQSEGMLAEIRNKWGDKVECKVVTGERLPLRTSSVDSAFANMYLHHVESPPHAIREMARILRPGGRLVITDLETHSFAFLASEHHDRWMGFAHADLRDWLEQAGLRDVTVTPAGETCCTDSTCSSERAEVGIFIAVGTKMSAERKDIWDAAVGRD